MLLQGVLHYSIISTRTLLNNQLDITKLVTGCAGIWVGLAWLEQAPGQAAVCEHCQSGSPCSPGVLLAAALYSASVPYLT